MAGEGFAAILKCSCRFVMSTSSAFLLLWRRACSWLSQRAAASGAYKQSAGEGLHNAPVRSAQCGRHLEAGHVLRVHHALAAVVGEGLDGAQRVVLQRVAVPRAHGARPQVQLGGELDVVVVLVVPVLALAALAAAHDVVALQVDLRRACAYSTP